MDPVQQKSMSSFQPRKKANENKFFFVQLGNCQHRTHHVVALCGRIFSSLFITDNFTAAHSSSGEKKKEKRERIETREKKVFTLNTHEYKEQKQTFCQQRKCRHFTQHFSPFYSTLLFKPFR